MQLPFFDKTIPRYFVPEIIQTSTMDCGPATLKCLLEGYGITASYGRLREACQTDVDGTSIDTLEVVANQLGLVAEQVMIPADFLLVNDTKALPAIVVIRQPNGLAHFIVAWRQHGRLVQVMDPGRGRRWRTQEQFLSDLLIHAHPLPASSWHHWARSSTFAQAMQQRMTSLEVVETVQVALLDQAKQADDWQPLARLEAAVRLTHTMIRDKVIQPGDEATQLLEHLAAPEATIEIPPFYWSVLLHPGQPPNSSEPLVLFRGAVLVRVLGRRDTMPDRPEVEETLSPELAAVLAEEASDPLREFGALLEEDGWLMPGLVVLASLAAALTTGIEALLFNSLFSLTQLFPQQNQLLQALSVFLLFLVVVALLKWPLMSILMRIGRRLETRLRIRFLAKVPRLGDRYFHSRLTSDMTERAHGLRQLRTIPFLATTGLQTFFQMVFTAIGVVIISPASILMILASILFTVGFTLLRIPILTEQDLTFRTHQGALTRFYLDSLLGLIPIRTHGAQPAVRRQHEAMMVEWIQAGYRFFQVDTLISGLEALVGVGFTAWIVFSFVVNGGETSGLLLLFYWSINLPALSKALIGQILQYPAQRNRLLRLLEPLTAPEEEEAFARYHQAELDERDEDEEATETAVAIALEGVTVVAGGHQILEEINLTIAAGEHVAIVGPSGAGKSSLVGLFLGWHRAAEGRVLVNNRVLTGERLMQLRQQTAWVDPAVRLWNRSLLDNLRYGNNESQTEAMSDTLTRADLHDVLKRLPDGLQTVLGEGGGLVSGGEGQRVRLGRALNRPEVHLVILDEPFRGLDRPKRQALLAQVRQYWHDKTLVFISHDVGDTQSFDRVLVIEEGRVVEDGVPRTLLAQTESRYALMLAAETAVRQGLWESSAWRRLWLENGQLQERSGVSDNQERGGTLENTA